MASPHESSPRAALVFDLDGTLIDSLDDIAAAVNVARQAMSHDPLPLDTIRSYIGDGLMLLLERSFNTTDPNTLNTAKAHFETYYHAHCTDLTRIYPNVETTLATLSKSYTLAVLSNKPEAFVHQILDELNLAQHFTLALGGDSLPVKKPDPTVMAHVAKTLNTQTLIMIGDHHTDLEVARNANCPSIFCTYGIGITDSETPTATINDMADLPRVVEGLL